MQTYIIYMAAGNSRRFTSNKLLFDYQNKPLYMHTLDKLIAFKEAKTIVVTQYMEIMQALQNITSIKTIYNPQSHLGVSYTIKAGLDAIKDVKKPFWVMFVVADQPYLTLETIKKMIEATKQTDKHLLSLTSQGQVGNPCMFHSFYLDELYQLENDKGGRQILKKHPEDVLYIDIANPLELKDIDYLEDTL